VAREWCVRKAGIDDAENISRLINVSFIPEQRSLCLYGCPGSENYIKDLIAIQDRGGDSLFLIAVGGEELLGFVEIRRLADSICLNYMATAEAARGLGVYKRLMKDALLLGKEESYQKAFHDVFFGNTIRDFHERIGYKVTKTFLWRATDLPSGMLPPRIVLTNLPQADVIHSRYGFSQFGLTLDTGSFTVGRLNTMWFRATAPTIVNNRDALHVLKHLEPSRSLLSICEQEAVLPTDLNFRQVLGSFRLEGEIDQILTQLK